MNDFEKKVLTFYTMIANAYHEPEDMEQAVEKLVLCKGQDRVAIQHCFDKSDEEE